MITLYILGGCVGVAALLFIVMIVLTAMRPPQLPDVTSHEPIEPPLQRMIRALTPPPLAPAGFSEPRRPTQPAVPTYRAYAHSSSVETSASPPMQRVAAVPSIAPRTLPPSPPPRSTAPAAVPRTAPPSAPPGPTPPPSSAAPFVWEDSSARDQSFGSHVARPRAPRAPLARSPITLPRYPVRRGRWLLRFTLVLFVTSIVAVGAAVAYPAMLDPLCDDYEWFGSDAVQVGRDYARDAHAAIADFIQNL
ncbi:MAG TPA: hypothetical protein VIV40_03805 [Kofleriaceae bacterium]